MSNAKGSISENLNNYPQLILKFQDILNQKFPTH